MKWNDSNDGCDSSNKFDSCINGVTALKIQKLKHCHTILNDNCDIGDIFTCYKSLVS